MPSLGNRWIDFSEENGSWLMLPTTLTLQMLQHVELTGRHGRNAKNMEIGINNLRYMLHWRIAEDRIIDQNEILPEGGESQLYP
jgi:hypothetical protein